MADMHRRIVIIDDHPLFREGLKAILANAPDWEVVGEAATLEEGRKIIQACKPGIVLLDLSLGAASGMQLINEMQQLCQGSKVLVISMHNKIDYIVNAVRQGAVGYIVKESAVDQLLFGLKQIEQGQLFFDSSVAQSVMTRLMGAPQPQQPMRQNLEVLTKREREILPLLAEGKSIKEIAFALQISHKTVENHRSNIMHKLQVHSNMDLFKFALQQGVLQPMNLGA